MNLFIYLFIFILLISFATAIDISSDNGVIGVNIIPPSIPGFVNATAYVNASEFWITIEGNLNDVSDISHSDLSDLLWSVAGHTIDIDIDMINNGLLNVGDIEGYGSGSFFNSTLLIDGDMEGGNATLVIEADSNHFACINLTEGNNIGMQICYDGAGVNRAFVISNLLDGNEYFWIDRTTGLIHFNNDTVAVSLITETINSTDWSNASSALSLWKRTGTALEPITAGDDINTTGNIFSSDVVASIGVFSDNYRDNSGDNLLFSWDGLEIDVAQDLNLGANNIFSSDVVASIGVFSDNYRDNSGFNLLFSWDGSEIDVSQDMHSDDNLKYLFGTAGDASIYYDGSDLIINPDEVGAGDVLIGGGLNLGVNTLSFGVGGGILAPIFSIDPAGLGTFASLDVGGDIIMKNDEKIDNSVDGSITFTSVGSTYNNFLTIDLDSGSYRADITAGLSTGGVAGNAIRFNSAILLADDIDFSFGGASDFRIRWATVGNDHARFSQAGASSAGTSQNFLFTGQYDSYSHAVSVDPTVFIHSKTVEETATDQWIGFTHDKTNGLITCGTGTISFDDENLATTGNFTGNQIYGEMWNHTHIPIPITFAVDGLFYNLSFNDSNVNGFEFDEANDLLIAQVNGKYKVSYMASGDGQNNHIYYTSVYISGVNQDRCESHKKMVAGGDIVTMTGSCFIDLVVDDYIQVRTADIGGPGVGNFYSSELNLIRIGDILV